MSALDVLAETERLRDEAVQALEDTKFAACVALERAGWNVPQWVIAPEPRTVELLREQAAR